MDGDSSYSMPSPKGKGRSHWFAIVARPSEGKKESVIFHPPYKKCYGKMSSDDPDMNGRLIVAVAEGHEFARQSHLSIMDTPTWRGKSLPLPTDKGPSLFKQSVSEDMEESVSKVHGGLRWDSDPHKKDFAKEYSIQRAYMKANAMSSTEATVQSSNPTAQSGNSQNAGPSSSDVPLA